MKRITVLLCAGAMLALSGGAAGLGHPIIQAKGKSLLLDFPKVQQELRLTPEQINKLKDVLKDLRSAVAALDPSDKKRVMAKMLDINSRGTKAALEVLKVDQVNRLQQMQLQIEGPYAFLDEDVADKLKLTLEQRKAIRKAYNEGRAELLDQTRERGGQKKMKEFEAAAMGKIMLLLTADQKRDYSQMLGERVEGLPFITGPLLQAEQEKK